MRLFETRIERGEGNARLVGRIQVEGGARRELYFSVREEFGGFLDDSADPFVPALLLPSMKAGRPLEIDPPVSETLLLHLHRAQDILASFHGLPRVEVRAPGRPSRQSPARAAATHFSGGVDSFYTLRRSLGGKRPDLPRVEYLLFFKGLEQPLSHLRGVEESIAAVAQVAAETDTTLVVVETNLREVFNPNYERLYFGAAVSSASLALASGLEAVLLPSGYGYAQARPWGSHPLLDELWSTDQQRIVHHGAEARRVEKIEALAREWPQALPRLRVCLMNSGGPSNCGRCRKCVRTMIALELLGALTQASLFPPRLPLDAARLLGQDSEPLVLELLDLGQRVAPRSPVTAMLERAIAHRRRREALRVLAADTPGIPALLAAARRVRNALRGTAD